MMRWNPRRRQVVSVVHVQSGKQELENAKSPWNTLEVAKIAVGALTPLLIAGFGLYVTSQTHADDVRRAVSEEVRARRSAALPIIFDLDQQFTKFANVASDATYRAHSIATVTPDKMQLAFDQLMRVNAATEEYKQRQQEDWLKLRPLLNNEKQYDDLHGLSVGKVFAPITSAAHDCVSAVIEEKGKELPAKCMLLLSFGRTSSCEFLVNYSLERFDSSEPVDLAVQSRREFCPDTAPVERTP